MRYVQRNSKGGIRRSSYSRGKGIHRTARKAYSKRHGRMTKRAFRGKDRFG